ncbi:MAG: diacylglycerol kinase family protein [Chloroflexota bacterium]
MTDDKIDSVTSLFNPDEVASQRATSVWQSFGFATEGMLYVLRTQRNAKIHLCVSICVVLMGLFLGITATQWAILFVMMGGVLAAEIMNAAIEAVVDLVSPDYHILAKIAKDTAAGAVFLLAIFSVIVGIFILGPPLLLFVLSLFG